MTDAAVEQAKPVTSGHSAPQTTTLQDDETSRQTASSLTARLTRWGDAALRSNWLPYAFILLLQLKVVWGAWYLRDLTSGDTSSYFVSAINWYRHWQVDIAWSPLYLAFYGTVMHVVPDAAAATILHRLIIVFAATFTVLAVLRRMLPHALALLVAVWWTVLPINFETLYEVHLFSLLPVLAAWLIIMRRPRTDAMGEWIRGCTLAALVATMFLVRNEMFVAVGVFGAVCFIYEFWRWKRGGRTNSVKPELQITSGESACGADPARSSQSYCPGRTLVRYVMPCCAAALLVGGFYVRSYDRYPALKEVMEIKHTLNMAQVYAYGYQQRHPEWTASPWTDYATLCQRDFGAALPSLTLMLRHNPRATLEHFAWNVHLVPAGLQVLLFDCTSGRVDPDYADVIYDPMFANRASFAVLAILAVGLVLIALRWRFWWEHWLRDRAWGWAAMLAVACTAFLIIPTQRPRPSYLFSLSVMLMALVGTCVFVIVRTIADAIHLRRHAGRLRGAGAVAMLLIMLGLLVRVPLYYEANPPLKPLQRTYEILLPHQADIRRKDTVFLKGEYAGEVGNYIGLQKPALLDYSVLDGLNPDESLAAFLDRNKVNLFFLDDRRWSQLEARRPDVVQALIDHGSAAGWRLIGFEDATSPQLLPPPYLARWLLFKKASPIPSGGFDALPVGLAPQHGETFSGWRSATGLGPIEGPSANKGQRYVCWGYGPSTVLTVTGGGRFSLVMTGLSGLADQQLTIKLDGQQLGQYPWGPAGVFHDLTVPIDLPPGEHQLQLDYAVWQSPLPSVRLAILFKKFQLLRENAMESATEKAVTGN